jgi:hypothetical protein
VLRELEVAAQPQPSVFGPFASELLSLLSCGGLFAGPVAGECFKLLVLHLRHEPVFVDQLLPTYLRVLRSSTCASV